MDGGASARHALASHHPGHHGRHALIDEPGDLGRVGSDSGSDARGLTSAPWFRCAYMLATCAWSCATRSGASASVMVRTPPGMSCTVRWSWVCRLNRAMYVAMSACVTSPVTGPR